MIKFPNGPGGAIVALTGTKQELIGGVRVRREFTARYARAARDRFLFAGAGFCTESDTCADAPREG